MALNQSPRSRIRTNLFITKIGSLTWSVAGFLDKLAFESPFWPDSESMTYAFARTNIPLSGYCDLSGHRRLWNRMPRRRAASKLQVGPHWNAILVGFWNTISSALALEQIPFSLVHNRTS
jgi:hypothetical protein